MRTQQLAETRPERQSDTIRHLRGEEMRREGARREEGRKEERMVKGER